jgi:hypothetical protein
LTCRSLPAACRTSSASRWVVRSTSRTRSASASASTLSTRRVSVASFARAALSSACVGLPYSGQRDTWTSQGCVVTHCRETGTLPREPAHITHDRSEIQTALEGTHTCMAAVRSTSVAFALATSSSTRSATCCARSAIAARCWLSKSVCRPARRSSSSVLC